MRPELKFTHDGSSFTKPKKLEAKSEILPDIQQDLLTNCLFVQFTILGMHVFL